MADTAEKGQVEGHTSRNSQNSGDGGVSGDLAQILAADAPALPGLDLPLDDVDVVAKAATLLNEKRRARGRPEGSANRRNAEVFDYLEARGFKAPELRLMEIVSADARELSLALLGTQQPDYVLEIIKLQAKAAAELMPYKFAKRNELKIDSTRQVQHVFLAGSMAQFGAVQGGYSLTNGADKNLNEINDETVRETTEVSHDTNLEKQ